MANWNESDAGEIILKTGSLRVAIEAENGGKIRSLRSQRTGLEYFYQDPRDDFGVGDGYGNHSISGFDECFPTVWACPYPDGERSGLALRDHGYLWGRVWQYAIQDERLGMSCEIPELGCRFERTCWVRSAATLSFDYRITNHGSQPLKYIYSAHPMLAAHEDSVLRLPRDFDRAYVFFAAGHSCVKQHTWIEWPPSVDENLSPPFRGSREACLKIYSPRLAEGRADIYHQDHGEGLRFDFDTNKLPHLGVLYQQGFDEDPESPFRGELFLGLEPTTGVGDDLQTCQKTGTVAELPAGRTKEFSIQLTLFSDDVN